MAKLIKPTQIEGLPSLSTTVERISQDYLESTTTLSSRIDTLDEKSYSWEKIVPNDGTAVSDSIAYTIFNLSDGTESNQSSNEVLVGAESAESLSANTSVLSAKQSRKEIQALDQKVSIRETYFKNELLNRIQYNSDILLRVIQSRIDLLFAKKDDVVAEAALGQPAIVADEDGALSSLENNNVSATNVRISSGISAQIKDNDIVLQDIVPAESAFTSSSFIPSLQYVDDAFKTITANFEKKIRTIQRTFDNRMDSIESMTDGIEHIIPSGETITLAHTPIDIDSLELIINGIVYYSSDGYFSVSGNVITWDSAKATFTLTSVCPNNTKVTIKYKWVDPNKITPVQF